MAIESLEARVHQAEADPLIQRYVPLDKTYVRVMLSLDDRYGYADSEAILAASGYPLPDDTAMYVQAQDDYYHRRPVHVGEGGANYRTLLYRSYLEDTPLLFVKEGSLKGRPMYERGDMTTMSAKQLAELDNRTTQYLIARMIWGDPEDIPDELIEQEFKLQVADEAIADWHAARATNEPWSVRPDATITRQAGLFLRALKSGIKDAHFEMMQAEDYCFARIYGYTTPEEGEKRWPRLRRHESDRIASVERAIKQATSGEVIDVNDHRVVQAIAMRWGLSRDRFKYPDCVTKSWPDFWLFIAEARKQSAATSYQA